MLERDVASLPAQLVGCICQPMWKPAAPVLAELVWDVRSIVAEEEQGHQGHEPQHIGGETTDRMGVGEGAYSFCTPIASIGPPIGRTMGSKVL